MSSEVALEPPPTGALEAAHERVVARAYELYVERGATEGHAFDDWLRAEAEVMNREAAG